MGLPGSLWGFPETRGAAGPRAPRHGQEPSGFKNRPMILLVPWQEDQGAVQRLLHGGMLDVNPASKTWTNLSRLDFSSGGSHQNPVDLPGVPSTARGPYN